MKIYYLFYLTLVKTRSKEQKYESLAEVSSKNDWVILGFDNCMFCDKAISLFKKNDVEFTYVPIKDKLHLRGVIKDKYKHTTLPCIFHKKRFIGGFDDLVRFYTLRGR